jgi:CBS-domain-containing membrane protein
MVVSNKPLFAMTANDLMSRQLVLLAQDMSLKGAAHLLYQSDVSGAPVVDGAGRCIGVLSAMDFVHMAEEDRRTRRDPCPCPQEAAFTSSQIMEDESEKAQTVRDVMKQPVQVLPNTNIGELAKMMRESHTHRVIVCDGEGRPVGLVSAMDVLGAVAQAYQTDENSDQASRPEQVDNLVALGP